MKNRFLLHFFIFLLVFLFGCGLKQGTEAAESPKPPSGNAGTEKPPAGTEKPPEESPSGTLLAYYPLLQNVRYIYGGEGNEYAPFDMYVDYTDETSMQQRISNSGTELVQVVKIENGKVTVVFRQEETYYRENLLNKDGNIEEVLLMEPIKAGTSWKLGDGRTRTITGVNVKVDTPSGRYSTVEVETTNSGGKTTEYYAQEVGLVKRVSSGESFEVSSYLSEIRKNTPFTQTVRFFYPGIDGKLYFEDRAVEFVTRIILEKTYKDQVPDQAVAVLPENASINSLYLNQDGMVYVDLSEEFIREMNAGAGYEQLILQSVVNTFGSYYNAGQVVLTIDGKPYESGHIALQKGEHLKVDTEGSVELS